MTQRRFPKILSFWRKSGKLDYVTSEFLHTVNMTQKGHHIDYSNIWMYPKLIINNLKKNKSKYFLGIIFNCFSDESYILAVWIELLHKYSNTVLRWLHAYSYHLIGGWRHCVVSSLQLGFKDDCFVIHLSIYNITNFSPRFNYLN